MDITPQDSTTTQPMSDDQDLAKALAGVLPEEPEAPAAPAPAPASGLQFEETPVVAPAGDSPAVSPSLPTPDALPTPSHAPQPEQAPAIAPSEPAASPLDGIKNQALEELRPLIDRVDLPAEEKFDTYLMLIRSTDDSSLIAPAHAVAQTISDEKRKAEALLEIIKEIDYLSKKS